MSPALVLGGRRPSSRDEHRVLLEGEGLYRYLPPPGYRRELPAIRWRRNQETIMAKSRTKWRSLVGRIKNLLRRAGVLSLAFWALRILYEVAKLFDLFH
jgi:hypothetical protein